MCNLTNREECRAIYDTGWDYKVFLKVNNNVIAEIDFGKNEYEARRHFSRIASMPFVMLNNFSLEIFLKGIKEGKEEILKIHKFADENLCNQQKEETENANITGEITGTQSEGVFQRVSSQSETGHNVHSVSGPSDQDPGLILDRNLGSILLQRDGE